MVIKFVGSALVVLVITLAISGLGTNSVWAHPGGTDSSGGHTCRTNCGYWGYSYGGYHYHGGYRRPSININTNQSSVTTSPGPPPTNAQLQLSPLEPQDGPADPATSQAETGLPNLDIQSDISADDDSAVDQLEASQANPGPDHVKLPDWDSLSLNEKVRQNPEGCDLAGQTEVMWPDGSCHPAPSSEPLAAPDQQDRLADPPPGDASPGNIATDPLVDPPAYSSETVVDQDRDDQLSNQPSDDSAQRSYSLGVHLVAIVVATMIGVAVGLVTIRVIKLFYPRLF